MGARPRSGGVDRLIRDATRIVGAYDAGRQIGFARCFSDRVTLAWVGDVYVEASHRGRGIGEAVVRFLIEGSDFAGIRWMLGTADAHAFYSKLGFGAPGERILERPGVVGDPPPPCSTILERGPRPTSERLGLDLGEAEEVSGVGDRPRFRRTPCR